MRGSGDADNLEPLEEEDLEPGSFDLVAPGRSSMDRYSLEERSNFFFSTEHPAVIFADGRLLHRFTGFLCAHRQASIPLLIFYLDALKALRAIEYSNAVIEALEPLKDHDFSRTSTPGTVNEFLRKKADSAFQALAQEDLPAFVTHVWTQTVSASIKKRITGTLPAHLRDMSEGLAEVFCLTDPSQNDNPIVFASEGMSCSTDFSRRWSKHTKHRYRVPSNYPVWDELCHSGKTAASFRAPKTNPFSVRRIREKLEAGKEHYETFLNYRRDGAPFMNLLMCAPLFDSRGKVRYFIGAQVDVSGLAKDCVGLESLQRLVDKQSQANVSEEDGEERRGLRGRAGEGGDEFRLLSEMLNLRELGNSSQARGNNAPPPERRRRACGGSHEQLAQATDPDPRRTVLHPKRRY